MSVKKNYNMHSRHPITHAESSMATWEADSVECSIAAASAIWSRAAPANGMHRVGLWASDPF